MWMAFIQKVLEVILIGMALGAFISGSIVVGGYVGLLIWKLTIKEKAWSNSSGKR